MQVNITMWMTYNITCVFESVVNTSCDFECLFGRLCEFMWIENPSPPLKQNFLQNKLTVLKVMRSNTTDMCAVICDLFSWLDKFIVDAVPMLVNERDSCQDTLQPFLSYAHHLTIHGQGFGGAGKEQQRHWSTNSPKFPNNTGPRMTELVAWEQCLSSWHR